MLLLYSGPRSMLSTIEDEVGSTFTVEHVEPDRRCVIRGLGQADAYLDASMAVAIDEEALSEARNLRIVAAASTGELHLDRVALERRGIEVVSLRNERELLEGLTPAAELTWLLVLAAARRFLPAISDVQEGHWRRERFPGLMLKGRTLGIVGHGRLGRWVGRYGRAFGMRVLAHELDLSRLGETEGVALERLFEEADIVTLHIHADADNLGLVDSALLERLRPGAILVNTSRGEIVDERAVVDALQSGRLGAYACDVVAGEPAIEESLIWKASQERNDVLVTPHIGGFSPDALALVLRRLCTRILARFSHRG